MFILENVLEKIFKTISKNIPLDHLDHFCRKMQLDNDTIVDIENNRLVMFNDQYSMKYSILFCMD